MASDPTEQIKSLTESLDQMTKEISLIQARLNYVKLQLKLGKDHNIKINKMLFRWRVELAQSECRIIKVKEEVFNCNKESVSVAG